MIHGIVTDIEGTTSSIDFVHKVLFPYSRSHMLEFLKAHGSRDDIAPLIKRLWTEDLGKADGTKPELGAVCVKLTEWIDQDKKHPILKALQGKIWKLGYESQAFKGHVYPDVPTCLDAWKKQGLRLAVYSSGSVEAQKLLFGYSEGGDLTQYFSAYFDTGVGMKQEPASYTRIAEQLGMEPGSLLFLSDIALELDAAQKAGFQTCQLLRDSDVLRGKHTVANHFPEVEKLFLAP